MKFSINVDFLYKGKPLVESIKEIKSFGFDSVEICFMIDKTEEELEEAKKLTGIEYRLFMMDVINGMDANDPRKFDVCVEDCKKVADRCVRFGSKNVILGVGRNLEDEGYSRADQVDAMVKVAKAVMPYLEERGLNLLIEPINDKIDHKGTGLWSNEEAYEVIRRVDSPNMKMLYDIYHMQVQWGNVTQDMLDHLDMIEHVHCAGSPGRCEIYKGELDYHFILKTLKDHGYKGTVGIEFNPTVPVQESIPYMRKLYADLMD